jgi:type IV fimbrial biogenesis protein FimT
MMALPVPRVLAKPLRSHGFTLTEVLVVLAMISLLVVAASPTFVKLMRDRRVNRAASQIVDFMRSARTLAIGRGQPMLVSWNGNGVLPQNHPGGTGYLEVDEPIVVNSAVATNCTTTQWHNNLFTQPVWTFDIQDGRYDYTAVTFYNVDGTTAAGAEICFSPTGRMYLRTGSPGNVSGAFTPVLGVPSFAVFNLDTNPNSYLGAARWVYLLPNGTARLQL